MDSPKEVRLTDRRRDLPRDLQVLSLLLFKGKGAWSKGRVVSARLREKRRGTEAPLSHFNRSTQYSQALDNYILTVLNQEMVQVGPYHKPSKHQQLRRSVRVWTQGGSDHRKDSC